MTDDLDGYLDGEVAADSLDASTRAHAAAWDRMVESFRTAAPSAVAPAWLEQSVMADIEALLPPVGQRTPANMVDTIATLLGVQLSGVERNSLITYVSSELQGDTIVNVGFDPTDDDELLMKTRGLLWMTAQYWEGHQ